jgi:hypothetical protein
VQALCKGTLPRERDDPVLDVTLQRWQHRVDVKSTWGHTSGSQATA